MYKYNVIWNYVMSSFKFRWCEHDVCVSKRDYSSSENWIIETLFLFSDSMKNFTRNINVVLHDYKFTVKIQNEFK